MYHSSSACVKVLHKWKIPEIQDIQKLSLWRNLEIQVSAIKEKSSQILFDFQRLPITFLKISCFFVIFPDCTNPASFENASYINNGLHLNGNNI